jgi:hypothetical protein
MKKIGKTTLLELMDTVFVKSENSRLGGTFMLKAAGPLGRLSSSLGVTRRQAALFCVCLGIGTRRITLGDISSHLDVSFIRILSIKDDLVALVHAGYLKCRNADEDSFEVPGEVVTALENGRVPERVSQKGLSGRELLARVDELLRGYDEGAIGREGLVDEVKSLFSDNKNLSFVRALTGLEIPFVPDGIILIILCVFLVSRKEEEVEFQKLRPAFDGVRQFFEEKNGMLGGGHGLLRQGLVETMVKNGGDSLRIRLAAKARALLLPDFDISRKERRFDGLIKHESLTEKTLFYTEKTASQVEDLVSALTQDKHEKIMERLERLGYRKGLACIMHGAPGTGKTETCKQVARKTGRDIMKVNISEIKSKWVGESERNIKAVFDRYRMIVRNSKLAPILLFNEADAIFGIRMQGASMEVDKMEGAIQNIILQEMEDLEGILIATTNLTDNLDKAFERRFLYKICFEQPDASVREKIWHTMLPTLSAEECATLASSYYFSGGEIENVARKCEIDSVLHGDGHVCMETLKAFCDEERLAEGGRRRIGF